jgi:tRNA pseudouridine32 synthase
MATVATGESSPPALHNVPSMPPSEFLRGDATGKRRTHGTGQHAQASALSSLDQAFSGYIFEDGLRKVPPYHFTYKTWCKERWRGRSLIDIFDSEFRDRPLDYYRKAMEAGLVRINETPVGPNYIVKNGDLVSHTLHRHEPSVAAAPIAILHEDEELLVINKPAGIPVHPAGRYNYNSVLGILRAERGPEFKSYPCNRLDRLTSGIMFVAKTPKGAERLGRQITGRTVRKEYIARVVGRFPDGDIVCDQPILNIAPKVGLNRVRANGKDARSVFRRLAYYGPADLADDRAGYSIVRCFPVTGRTHQLRVHLQYLGHPIVNDPIYANRGVWGIDLGRGDADASENSDETVISRLNRMGKDQIAEAVAYYDEMVDKYEKKAAEKLSGELCEVCATPLYTEPGLHELVLWLHSRRYEDMQGTWSYETPLPAWALPPEGTDGPRDVDPIQIDLESTHGKLGDATSEAVVAEAAA